MIRKLAIAATLLGLSASAGLAQGIPCGGTYAVSPGDTLNTIAVRAYGTRDGWNRIYRANRDIIGPNPGRIEIGQPLVIPCPGDEVPPSAAPAAAAPTEDPAPAAPARPATTQAALPGGIRFVTGSGWAPFSDANQADGGMMTDVVNRAMVLADPDAGYRIDFIEDWGAHLRPLLTDNAYDFAFPWFRPNCDVAERLSADSRFRCENFDWSDAIFEQIIGYYTAAGYRQPSTHADLYGSVLCRPAGYSTFMLEEHGLLPPQVTLISPPGPADCVEALLTGQAQVAVLAVDTANGAVRERGATGRVVRHENLDSIATLHVVTSKGNPRGAEYLQLLNEGLDQLKDSGAWFAIVRRHLAEFRRNS